MGVHTDTLYKQIKQGARSIRQAAYCMNLSKMAASFQTSFEDLCEELVALIRKGDIKASIDVAKRTLRARSKDERLACFKRSVEIGKKFEAETKAMLVRLRFMDGKGPSLATTAGLRRPADSSSSEAGRGMPIADRWRDMEPMPATPPYDAAAMDC